MTPETKNALSLLFAFGLLGSLVGLIVLVIYVIVHFVIKFW